MESQTTEHRDEDDTGIDPGPSTPSLRPARRREAVRVGRWFFPSVAVSAAASVMVHAGVITLVCLVVRWWGAAPGLSDRWAGGGSIGGIASDRSSTDVSIESKPPPMTDSAVHDQPLQRVVMEDAADALPDWDKVKATTVADSNNEKPQSQIIGISGVALADAAPARGGHQHASAAPAMSGQSSSGAMSSTPPSSPAASDSAGEISGPGLPGAIASKRLPTPAYPAESRRRGEQGVVRIELEILPDGTVGQISVRSDPGFPLLREAALKAAQKLRDYPFTPARRLGVPVRDSVVIPYAFSLR